MTGSAGGHLFVVNGDLGTLACDAIVLPRDRAHQVSHYWFSLFDVDRAPSEGYADLPRTAKLKEVERGPRHWSTVDTVSEGTIPGMVQLVVEAIAEAGEAIARSGADSPESGRAKPLVALPLPGTGEGLFGKQRGKVIRAVLESLAEQVPQWDFDVALVLRRRSNFTAVQSIRGVGGWGELPTGLRDQADRLGQLAAKGQLSLFVGAGVSQALGLPGWRALVDVLLSAAEQKSGHTRKDSWESDLLAAAQWARKRLPDDEFATALRTQLDTSVSALSHSLLAGLGLQRTVTTNFDGAFEIAHRGAFERPLTVMASQWAQSDQPWLLKLHGDLDTPDSIVLTKKQYANDARRRPLYGLVQGLLMTSHLLFVGFSMTDKAFVDLADGVERLYESAGAGKSDRVATVLSLKPLRGDTQWAFGQRDAIHALSMGDSGSDAHLARQMEIFLDRLAWSAAAHGVDAFGHLLAEAYEGILGEEEKAVRQALLGVATSADSLKAGPLKSRLETILKEMGTP